MRCLQKSIRLNVYEGINKKIECNFMEITAVTVQYRHYIVYTIHLCNTQRIYLWYLLNIDFVSKYVYVLLEYFIVCKNNISHTRPTIAW